VLREGRLVGELGGEGANEIDQLAIMRLAVGTPGGAS
jgi:hypothetical protein